MPSCIYRQAYTGRLRLIWTMRVYTWKIWPMYHAENLTSPRVSNMSSSWMNGTSQKRKKSHSIAQYGRFSTCRWKCQTRPANEQSQAIWTIGQNLRPILQVNGFWLTPNSALIRSTSVKKIHDESPKICHQLADLVIGFFTKLVPALHMPCSRAMNGMKLMCAWMVTIPTFYIFVGLHHGGNIHVHESPSSPVHTLSQALSKPFHQIPCTVLYVCTSVDFRTQHVRFPAAQQACFTC